MAPTSWTAVVSLLLALTASGPALALPQDPAVGLPVSPPAALPTALPSIAMTTPIRIAEAPLQTPGPSPAPSGQQPSSAGPPQSQKSGEVPKGAPNAGAAGGTGPAGAVGASQGAGNPQGPFQYQPSFSTAAGAAILFLGSMVVTVYQFFKYKTWFMMMFPQAVAAHAVACIARIHAIMHPKDKTAYIVQTMCFQMVPTLIAINAIMIFTRVVWWCTPNEKRSKKAIGMPIHHISLIWAGIVAVPDLVKAVAANLGKPKDPKAHPDPKSIYNRVQQVALVIQFLALAGWVAWAAVFMRKANKWIVSIEVERARYRVLGWATVLAGALLSWRVLYMIIEHDAMAAAKSYISTHEWLFWFAGQLPMFFVYTIYNVWHPGKFFPRDYTRFKFDTKKLDKKLREQAWPPPISHPIPSQSSGSDPTDQKAFDVTMTEMVPHPGRKV